jgi:hypothetical protein
MKKNFLHLTSQIHKKRENIIFYPKLFSQSYYPTFQYISNLLNKNPTSIELERNLIRFIFYDQKLNNYSKYGEEFLKKHQDIIYSNFNPHDRTSSVYVEIIVSLLKYCYTNEIYTKNISEINKFLFELLMENLGMVHRPYKIQDVIDAFFYLLTNPNYDVSFKRKIAVIISENSQYLTLVKYLAMTDKLDEICKLNNFRELFYPFNFYKVKWSESKEYNPTVETFFYAMKLRKDYPIKYKILFVDFLVENVKFDYVRSNSLKNTDMFHLIIDNHIFAYELKQANLSLKNQKMLDDIVSNMTVLLPGRFARQSFYRLYRNNSVDSHYLIIREMEKHSKFLDDNILDTLLKVTLKGIESKHISGINIFYCLQSFLEISPSIILKLVLPGLIEKIARNKGLNFKEILYLIKVVILNQEIKLEFQEEIILIKEYVSKLFIDKEKNMFSFTNTSDLINYLVLMIYIASFKILQIENNVFQDFIKFFIIKIHNNLSFSLNQKKHEDLGLFEEYFNLKKESQFEILFENIKSLGLDTQDYLKLVHDFIKSKKFFDSLNMEISNIANDYEKIFSSIKSTNYKKDYHIIKSFKCQLEQIIKNKFEIYSVEKTYYHIYLSIKVMGREKNKEKSLLLAIKSDDNTKRVHIYDKARHLLYLKNAKDFGKKVYYVKQLDEIDASWFE